MADTTNWNMAERLARITFSLIAEPGDAHVAYWVRECGGFEAALLAIPHYVGDNPSVHTWRQRLATNPLSATTERMSKTGIGTVIPGDSLWPLRMNALGDSAPWILYYRGEEVLLDEEKTIAIVGARAASAYGEHVARDWSIDLTSQGIMTVSGGAYGIDAAVHRASLSAGGQTIAIMAGGLDRYYPSGNQDLLEEIARVGLVVSEAPPLMAPTRSRFLARNRLIAALGDMTLVVEAGHRSGSLSTANHARRLGRMVCAVPGPITSATSAGCHDLIADSHARLVASSGEVMRLGGWQ